MAFSTFSKVILILALILVVTKYSSALKCYTCLGSPSGPCGNNFNPSHPDVLQETCKYGFNYCAGTKIIQPGTDTTIARACVDTKVPSARCATKSGVTGCAYTCSTDLCNNYLSFNGGPALSNAVPYKILLSFAIIITSKMVRLI